MSTRHNQKTCFVVLLFLTTTLIAGFTLTPYVGFASPQNNNTLIEPEASQDMASSSTTTNATTTTTNTTKPNIVLVHGGWADGGSWSKVLHHAEGYYLE
jgi:pimeloyl-ACP methyl ester carboxylesterase